MFVHDDGSLAHGETIKVGGFATHTQTHTQAHAHVRTHTDVHTHIHTVYAHACMYVGVGLTSGGSIRVKGKSEK